MKLGGKIINVVKISKVLASASHYGARVPNISFIHINDNIDSARQNSVLLFTSCLFVDYYKGHLFTRKQLQTEKFVVINLLFRLIYG